MAGELRDNVRNNFGNEDSDYDESNDPIQGFDYNPNRDGWLNDQVEEYEGDPTDPYGDPEVERLISQEVEDRINHDENVRQLEAMRDRFERQDAARAELEAAEDMQALRDYLSELGSNNPDDAIAAMHGIFEQIAFVADANGWTEEQTEVYREQLWGNTEKRLDRDPSTGRFIPSERRRSWPESISQMAVDSQRDMAIKNRVLDKFMSARKR